MKFRELLGLDVQGRPQLSRRSFFKHATVLGATAAAGAVLAPQASALLGHKGSNDDVPNVSSLTSGDRSILIAAEIAEALAVTTYSHIIKRSPFFKRIPDDDQGYIEAALQEEMSHYALEQSVTNENTPFDEFFYPKQMFHDTQTTLNTLVTLEDG